MCLVTVKDRDLFHDASIRWNETQKGLDRPVTPGVPGPDGLAVAALVVAADPIGLADVRLATVPNLPWINDAPLPCNKEESQTKCDENSHRC